MWDYIVMGQVPGTSVQVTFAAWVFTMVVLMFAVLIYSIVRHALADDTAALASLSETSQPVELKRRKAPALATKLILAIRIRHIVQTAAYSRWLITRQHIQA